jgi:hypothetical protein
VSFDLVVLSGARPLDADQARAAYHELASGADWRAILPADTRIAQFVAELASQWPDFGELDESPAHAILSITGSAPEAVIDFCESRVSELGLNLFDPQDGTLYSPGRKPRKATPVPEKTLVCEHCGKAIEPGTPHAESPKLMHLDCMFQTLH